MQMSQPASTTNHPQALPTHAVDLIDVGTVLRSPHLWDSRTGAHYASVEVLEMVVEGPTVFRWLALGITGAGAKAVVLLTMRTDGPTKGEAVDIRSVRSGFVLAPSESQGRI